MDRSTDAQNQLILCSLVGSHKFKPKSQYNFPTVPSRPYLNHYCTIYMHVYYMLYVCVVLSIIKATSVFCMYGLDLYQTSTGPDRFPCSPLFHHMACFLFVVVTTMDQVVGLLPLGQCLLLFTPRNSTELPEFHGIIMSTFHVYERNK